MIVSWILGGPGGLGARSDISRPRDEPPPKDSIWNLEPRDLNLETWPWSLNLELGTWNLELGVTRLEIEAPYRSGHATCAYGTVADISST